jgi:hypothetical protein
MDGGHAERSERQALHRFPAKRRFDASEGVGAPRHAALDSNRSQQPNVLAIQPVESKRERPRGRRVQPLRVIHGKEDRPAFREVGEQGSEPCADGAGLEVTLARVVAEGCDLEGPSLRWGKVGEGLIRQVAKQVREADIR